MKRIALCIGNDNYSYLSALSCAVCDAESISESLERIGFETRVVKNLDREGLNYEIISFCEKIKDYDLGLLYYAGHGFQCDSDNILAPVDLNINKLPAEVRMDSFPLSELLQQMGKSVLTNKIIILDACRESLGYRGSFRDFSPMIAPQGSIIAFSTSPGQTARENSKTKHGKYTEALLNYLELPRVPIETVFKKVREQLAAQTGGGQIPWEHTSLIGDVYLNPDIIYDGVSYGKDTLADSEFRLLPDSQVKDLIDLFKTGDYTKQERAVSLITNIDYSKVGNSELFILGRNITRAIEGNSFASQRFIDDFSNKRYIPIEAKQHLLNGITYEMYFDSQGKIRKVYCTKRLFCVLRLLESDDFFSCREFISSCLNSVEDRPIYNPGQKEIIDLLVITSDSEEKVERYSEIRKIEDIIIKGKSCYVDSYLLQKASLSTDNKVVSFGRFEIEICEALGAPQDYLRIKMDYKGNKKNSGYEIPYNGFIFRYEIEEEG